MNVPDVVQALRMITEFSAVSWSPIQFWFGPNPNSVDERVRARSASRTLLNSPNGETMKIHRIVIAAELAIAGK